MVNILAIGAHPDDIEIGCGGSLIKHLEKGNDIYGLVLTRGNKGNHPQNLSECKHSAELMGLKDLFVLDFQDTMLPDNGELVSSIIDVIKNVKPSRVYCHTERDYHQDHRHASLACQNASRISGVQEVLLFETPSVTVDFVPHYVADITNFFQKKIGLLQSYESQLKRNDSVLNMDWISSRAFNWGFKLKPRGRNGHKYYAEAFEINHILEF